LLSRRATREGIPPGRAIASQRPATLWKPAAAYWSPSASFAFFRCG